MPKICLLKQNKTKNKQKNKQNKNQKKKQKNQQTNKQQTCFTFNHDNKTPVISPSDLDEPTGLCDGVLTFSREIHAVQ